MQFWNLLKPHTLKPVTKYRWTEQPCLSAKTLETRKLMGTKTNGNPTFTMFVLSTFLLICHDIEEPYRWKLSCDSHLRPFWQNLHMATVLRLLEQSCKQWRYLYELNICFHRVSKSTSLYNQVVVSQELKTGLNKMEGWWLSKW